MNQPDMVNQEHCCEEEGSNMDRPEENCNLGPGDVHARHEDQEGEDKLQQSKGGHQTKLSPDVQGVEVGTVQHPHPHPAQEQHEVSVVEMSHTVPSKHAVVLPLEHTDPTHSTVPGPRGGHSLAHSTIGHLSLPSCALGITMCLVLVSTSQSPRKF